MLLSWCVDSSLPKAHCGWGWSLLPPLVNLARDRPIWPCAAEGLREGAGKAALGREGAASAVALAHCSRARAREKCARLKRGVWGALVACRDRATHDKRRRVWDRGFSMKGTYLFMFLHPLTFSQDYMITSRIV